MAILDNIKPERVMYWFEKLCSIPHGSGNTSQATAMCREFAKENNLEFIEDELGNCIIKKPATKGYENSPAVIIQGHLDMVCEKEASCGIDFENHGLELGIDGDWIYAKGTTLGGDDGAAIAIGLALLEDKEISHPALEILFTVDEEIGMIGATALDASPLKGKYLINLDSEDEGVFTVSCAGGVVAECKIPVKREEFSGKCYAFEISGLTGGHSGAEITKYRANADMLLGRLLSKAADAAEIRIVSVNGGLKDNAIPTSAEAVVVANADISHVAAECEAIFSKEFSVSEKTIKVSCTASNAVQLPMDRKSTNTVIAALCCYPNGIQNMSLEIPGLPKTSLNLGILKTFDECITASFCVRSSVLTEKEALVKRIELLTEQFGGTVKTEGDYPPWEYVPESHLRDVMQKVYVRMYGKEPIIEAIHAGIECGIIASKVPGLECVSIGPDIQDIHTPAERMSISSVNRTWKYITEVLRFLK